MNALKKEEKTEPHKSVGDSIFESFMEEPEEKEEENIKVEKDKEISLKIDEVLLKTAQKYSKRRLPYISLYMMRDESILLKESKSLHYYRRKLCE